MAILRDPLLHRFWFELRRGLGVGVTAHSREEAQGLARAACDASGWEFDLVQVVEGIDVADLDQSHVVPNMGPPNFKGVWFPRMNI